MTEEVAAMNRKRLNLVEGIDVVAPASLRRDLYEAGFAHALQGGQLDRIEYFKLSFREGFRAGKLHIRDLRRKAGVIDFPLRGKLKVKSYY